MNTLKPDHGFAAVFIDFENLYYELKNASPSLEATDYILTVIRSLRRHLEEVVHASPIIIKAYADFERLDSSPQGSLYLMGVETHNVLGTEHKNAADMRLCIDTLEVLYTRPEIHTFVLVAGDRDYIPVVQHLRRQGRNVLVSSFRSNLSGDLLQNIQHDKFIDAFELLSEEERREMQLARARAEQTAGSGRRKSLWTTRSQPLVSVHGESTAAPVTTPVADLTPAVEQILPVLAVEQPKAAGAVHIPELRIPAKDGVTEIGQGEGNGTKDYQFAPERPIQDETTRRCLAVMLEHFGQHREIWMSPLLWKLSNAMPLLADFERKALIATLQTAGAIKVIKRHGETHDYSVVVINYNHKAVRECMP